MSMRSFLCLTAGAIISLSVVVGVSGQAAAEYAGVTAATSTAGTALKPPPVPALKLPLGDNAPSSTQIAGVPRDTVSTAAAEAAEKTESAAKANLKFFQDRSGSDGADVTVTTAPNHAEAWVDDRYVGATPLSLKLGPGQHRLFVSGANSSESFREFRVIAKRDPALVARLQLEIDRLGLQGASPSANPTQK